jgi:integrase
MPSIINRDGRWRALVRKAGHTRCATFGTQKDAKEWAAAVERELDEIKAHGVMQPRGVTVANLIDRYTRELYPVKPWSASKQSNLENIKEGIGAAAAGKVTSFLLTEHFRQKTPLVAATQLSYLVVVLRVARSLWKLDVPVQAVVDARQALAAVGLIRKSKRRERRVSNTELAVLCSHFDAMRSGMPLSDILRFCVASAMRIGEVCRLRWEDLDREARTIVIRDRKHPTEKVGNDQIVPLLDATGFDALAIIERQPQHGKRIFPVNSKTVTDYVYNAVHMCELENLHLHDLRHESVSRLFAAGFPIQQVALVSGHRDWKSLKRYTHVKASDVHRRAEEARAQAAVAVKP